MNENAKKWIEALRSGEFEQAQDYLRLHNDYCCLGVACELYRRETGEGKWLTGLDLITPMFKVHGAEGIGTLPGPVCDWLGLRTNLGEILDDNSLASKNDAGESFEEIARIIESEPEGLFG